VPRPQPVLEAADVEFDVAARQGRLVVQHCPPCDRWQYPPADHCTVCGGPPVWRRVEGRGTVHSFAVVLDTPFAVLRPDLPFVAAVVAVDGCPGVLMASPLNGVAPECVRVGLPVRTVFVETEATGRTVPEWAPVE
jgi:uncharacterized protein